MDSKNKPKYEFTNKITGSSLPTDTFLEKLREFLTNNSFSCSQTKEKTGEAKTTGVGETMEGDLGGGIAHSDIITNKWNPFNIKCGGKTCSFLGRFKGNIKLTEMAKYSKKKRDIHYELKDYNLTGNIDFSPYGFWMFILFCVGIYLSFKFSTGFWIGKKSLWKDGYLGLLELLLYYSLLLVE